MVSVGQALSGKYRLVRLLGDGGMGSVYEARHEGLGTRVAIKVLHADLARREGLVERFLREARVSAQIRSPNVVQVMDVDRTDQGDAYIVMELLEGEPLSRLLERQGRVPIPIAVDYTKQILEALEAAHALGVVHRDLKPENVFLTFVAGKPVLKLIDFGIAKATLSEPGTRNLTVAGVVMGTAEYMAPEQAFSADKVDARSDLYAVGVMLYEMIAGARPISGEDARIIALKVERGEAVPLVHALPDVPRELAGLVHRAMAARPELRFASATEMRLALEVALAGKGRTPTARLPQSPQGALTQSQPKAELQAAPLPHRATGTVLGAPLGPPEGGAAVPVGGPYAPYVPAPMPPAQGHERRRSRRSSIWLLVALPVLLGAGVAVAFAVSNATSDTPPAPTPTTPAVPPPPVVPAAPATTSPVTPPNTVAPLTPPSPSPVRPPPRPHPSGSAAPPDTVVPVLPFPSGFPSGFPSTFPSSLPLPFPTTTASGGGPVIPFPSALPFPIPGLPTTPPPQPAPSAPPSNTSASF